MGRFTPRRFSGHPGGAVEGDTAAVIPFWMSLVFSQKRDLSAWLSRAGNLREGLARRLQLKAGSRLPITGTHQRPA